MTEFTGTIDHDAEHNESGTGFDNTDNQIRMTDSGDNSATRYRGMFIKDNITIPQGSTINSAVISGYVYIYDDPNLDIYCEDVDDSDDFTGTADINSRVRTTASVEWVATNIGTNAYKDSPDFASAVQEVVDRAGFSSGNSIGVIMVPKGTTNNGFYLRSTEYTLPPSITIDYTEPEVGSGGETTSRNSIALKTCLNLNNFITFLEI